MSRHTCGPHVTDVDWKRGLLLPKAKGFARDLTDYPATVLGELAFQIRELYSRENNYPRPTSTQLAQTSRLVGLLSREFQRLPLCKRSAAELELINYLVTPRGLWSEVNPFHQAIQAIVSERFAQDGKVIAARLRRAWSGGALSESVYHLQQIAINLCMINDFHEEVAFVVSSAIPSERRFGMSGSVIGGASALLSMCAQRGDDQANRLLLSVGLSTLYQAEGVDRLFVIDPVARPTEYRFVSSYLAELLRLNLYCCSEESGLEWLPTTDEVVDITCSWLEGGSWPVHNFVCCLMAMKRDYLAPLLKELYYRNGIRNFRRLELGQSDDPWSLMRCLAERDASATAGRDIILVATGSNDHNNAFRECGGEFEAIRSAGDSQGWAFDFVEVRDNAELAHHILRHHEQGSRIAVLHHLGHGSREGAEYGHLDREERSELNLATLFTNRDSAEMCSIAAEAVDTWVLHHCATGAPKSGQTRKISNLMEALHRATDGKVNITGLRGDDAFDTLRHRRDFRGRVLFTGKAVWKGAKRVKAYADA